MLSIILYYLCYVLTQSEASLISRSHSNRACVEFFIPVKLSAQNVIYDAPRVDSNIDAVEYALQADTWSTAPAPLRIKKNITIEDTFFIHAQLCTPNDPKAPKKSSFLQIATHGLVFDKRYWDPTISPSEYSYVNSALAHGYSILTYSRLGTGLSSKPSAYTTVQGPLELEILRSITLMARSGHLQSLIPHKPSTPPALTALRTTPFTKIIHIGYSFGSFLSAALLSRYGNLSDATVLTGYIPNAHAANIKLTSFGMELARTNDPVKFADRGSGYIVQGTPSNVHAIFFKAPFDPAALAYAHSIKQPITVGEYSSVATLPLGPAPNFKGPLLFMEAEFDFPICGGDCKTGWDPKVLRSIYSGASAVDVYVQPGVGHGLTLHRNATGGYGVMMSWLGEHGF